MNFGGSKVDHKWDVLSKDGPLTPRNGRVMAVGKSWKRGKNVGKKNLA